MKSRKVYRTSTSIDSGHCVVYIYSILIAHIMYHDVEKVIFSYHVELCASMLVLGSTHVFVLLRGSLRPEISKMHLRVSWGTVCVFCEIYVRIKQSSWIRDGAFSSISFCLSRSHSVQFRWILLLVSRKRVTTVTV